MYDIIGAFHTQRGGEICEPHGVEVYRYDIVVVVPASVLLRRAACQQYLATSHLLVLGAHNDNRDNSKLSKQNS